MLLVIVRFIRNLLSSTRGLYGSGVISGVVVDRDSVDVVQAPDEVVYRTVRGQFFDEGGVGGPDPFALESD